MTQFGFKTDLNHESDNLTRELMLKKKKEKKILTQFLSSLIMRMQNCILVTVTGIIL